MDLSNKEMKRNKKPWITPGILKSINKKKLSPEKFFKIKRSTLLPNIQLLWRLIQPPYQIGIFLRIKP